MCLTYNTEASTLTCSAQISHIGLSIIKVQTHFIRMEEDGRQHLHSWMNLAYKLLYEYLTWKWFFNTIYKKLIISYTRYFINKILHAFLFIKFVHTTSGPNEWIEGKPLLKLILLKMIMGLIFPYCEMYFKLHDECIDFLLFTVFFGLDVFLGETKNAQRILSSLSWDI